MAQDFSLRYPLVDSQGNLRLGRRRYRRDAHTRGVSRASRPSPRRHRPRRPSTSSRTTTTTPRARARRPAGEIPNLPAERTPQASPSAWRPSCRTTCGSSTAASRFSRTRTSRRSAHALSRPGLPDRRIHLRGGPIRDAYATGRGILQMRASAGRTEDRPQTIIVDDPVPGEQGAGLIERIADLVNEKKIEGHLRPARRGDRHGMRIVELESATP